MLTRYPVRYDVVSQAHTHALHRLLNRMTMQIANHPCVCLCCCVCGSVRAIERRLCLCVRAGEETLVCD
jgi:hypothetical protein